MVNPLFFLPLLAKNVTLFNAIAAAEIYGHHRAYRRFCEVLKQLNLSNEKQRVLKENLKLAIRAPADAYQFLSSSEMANLAEQYLSLNSNSKKAPPFVTSIAKAILKRTSIGKIVDIGEKAVSKRNGKKI
jgi:hypothetical protein